MPKLQLTLACWNYDRTRALLEGRVTVDGVDLNYLNLPVEETFFRMLRHREFDVAEMSLSSYTLSLFRENPPFIAIPVFPSRMFRHSCIYIHAGSGIREPKDLTGKRVGSPGISNDCAGLDSRHFERRVRRARYQPFLLHRRRGAARPSGEDCSVAAAADFASNRFPPPRRFRR